ncbi:shikimate kinase [Phyllobacterium endophyticum]|uniref:Shikimate kinase n=1 Tax=Phyllobacterium endophyticum TaxID=1149773 RepID=A0A2P7ALJ8_9HYPH|nr:shikimate kinase [Phyllobacterium endophyticum]MBB3236407.1 shikimate kinase [Phyllobacterium endophyticum]PSH55066.1 shikimate kinase [Phyllobacterium endophyticum]TYR39939.1 shikimate kinase [Phyllobacterium endophyticum]
MNSTENIAGAMRVPELAKSIRERLGHKSIVLVGLMGAGKSTVGKKLASMVELPFFDADNEIEKVSTMTIPELFEAYGEAEFRDLERRVIARMLESGPIVLATGGGAYMSELTREAIASEGISLWLKAELDVLMARVARKQNRPLLRNDNPRGVMERLMVERHPIYSLADLVVNSRDEKKEIIALEAMEAIAGHLQGDTSSNEVSRS